LAKFEDRDRGWRRIRRQLKLIDNSYTKVGVQQGELHKSADGELSDLVVIAAVNELGTRRIPSRPFMRNAVDGNQVQLYRTQLEMYSDVVQGKKTVRTALSAIGEFMTAKVKREIKTLRTPPNAPATVKRKGSDNPLIDQGQLIQSITHVEVVK
jgi:hypothetical protein